jgi:hypothetical protein
MRWKMADPVSFDGLNWLPYVVGSGGFTAVLVAYFGSKKPAPAASPSPMASQIAAAGIGAMLTDHISMDRLTNEMRRLADANENLARGVNRYCDLMDITKALERLSQHQVPQGRRSHDGD